MAVLLGSGPPGLGALGVAQDLLEKPGTGLGPEEQERALFTAMEVAPLAHLQGVRGLGEANRARVAAAFELGRRYALFLQQRAGTASGAPQGSIRHRALAKVSRELRTEAQEWLGFVPYFRSGELGGLCVAERGVRTHVNVDPAELFARILALRPAGFYLVHNHPSCDLTPSHADLELTERAGDLARRLGIRLLGHWIVAACGERWLDPPSS